MHGRRSELFSTLILVAVVVVLGPGGSQIVKAAERPPASNPPEVLATLEKHMSILGLRLMKDTTQDVENRLGKTQRVELHGQHLDAVVLCYKSVNTEDPTTVEFGTDFMAGYKSLTDFRITAGSSGFVSSDKCSKSVLVSKELATLSGLRLGLSRSDLITLLGPPKQSLPDSLEFDFFVQIAEMFKGELWCRHIHPHIKTNFAGSVVRELFVSVYVEGYQGECVKP